VGDSEKEQLDDLGPDDDRWDKPASGGPDEDRQQLRDRCTDERETMTPQETADCAGTALAEEFEGEEDGGS
jgi:hypothetical protein